MGRKRFTLCMIHQHPRVLLGMKKRGWGEGRWNGFGGKVQEGETLEEAARREVYEEIGVNVKDLEKRGTITFTYQDGSDDVEAHIFHCAKFEGEVTESEEMRPEWFVTDALPLEAMWPADTHWLPLFLAGKRFEGSFVLDRPSTSEETSVIIEKVLREL